MGIVLCREVGESKAAEVFNLTGINYTIVITSVRYSENSCRHFTDFVSQAVLFGTTSEVRSAGLIAGLFLESRSLFQKKFLNFLYF